MVDIRWAERSTSFMRGTMGRHSDYEQRTEKFLMSIQDEMAFEIVDVEFVKEGDIYILRALCDKEGGIGIEDCVNISRRLDKWLDDNDFIKESYTLEVSSPGLGRELKKDRDLIREKGKKVEIKLYKAIDKVKEFAGILREFDDENITIDTDIGSMTFERKNIAIIRLAIDF